MSGRRQGRKRQDTRTSTSSSPTSARTGCSCSWSSSATSGTPTSPTQDVDPGTPGPSRVRRPALQRDPRARSGRQLDPVASRTSPRPTTSNLYFGEGDDIESLKTYYEKQSSGRYSRRRRGHRLRPGPVQRGSLRPSVQRHLRRRRLHHRRHRLQQHLGAGHRRHDAVGRRPEGRRQHRRPDQGRPSRRYDKLDRYDFDGDGNFDEPDGYIDRFQIVHAGGDQADGDPYQGEDAIWSHRWYADYTDDRRAPAPANNLAGGTQIGTTGLWVGDYTIQAGERRAVRRSPTSTATTSACPTTTTPRPGRQPGQLVDADGAEPGLRPGRPGHRHPGGRPRRLGQAAARLARLRDGRGRDRSARSTSARTSTTASKAQGVAVVLPDKQVDDRPARRRPRASEAVVERRGRRLHRLDDAHRHRRARPGARRSTLKLHYNIEEDYDYACFEVEAPAGSGNWVQLPTTAVDPDTGTDARRDRHRRGQRRLRAGVRPTSRRTPGRPSASGPATPPTVACMGQDPSLGWSGLFVDDIQVTYGRDDGLRRRRREPAERLDARRVPVGGGQLHHGRTTSSTWRATGRTRRYDKYLKTGPYNFGFGRPGRTSWSTSRTRTACSSTTGTRRTPTTTPASTRVAARSCRSTPTRR